MQKAIATNLFFINSSISDLVVRAERAYTEGRMSDLHRVATQIRSLETTERISLGDYYAAHALCMGGRGMFNEADKVYSRLINDAMPKLKARAMLALSNNAWRRGDMDEARRLNEESQQALRFINDPVGSYYGLHTQAILLSESGDHNASLEIMNRSYPLVIRLGVNFPALRFEYLNSLAVELMEVGRIESAERCMSQVIQSPFVSNKPPWQETYQDVKKLMVKRGRSTIFVPHSFGHPHNQVVSLLEYKTKKTGQEPSSPESEPTESIPIQLFRGVVEAVEKNREFAMRAIIRYLERCRERDQSATK